MSECDTSNNSLEIKSISEEISKMKHEIDDLYETIYKGNGKPSLVTRTNNMEAKLSGLRESMEDKISHISSENALRFESINQKIDSKFTRLESWIDQKMNGVETLLRNIENVKKIDRTGSWQMKAALITAAAAIMGLIISNIFKI